jgi:repressor LexA
VSQTGTGNAVLPPAVHRGKGRIHHAGYRGAPAERVDDLISYRLHRQQYAISADFSQGQSAIMVVANIADHRFTGTMTPQEIRDELEALDIKVRDLAQLSGVPENYLSKVFGKAGRKIQHHEMIAIERALAAKRAEMEGTDSGAFDTTPLPKIPLLGDVPAGSPQEAIEISGKWHPVTDPDTPPRAYALRIKGDSMDKLVPDGATITVDPDDRDLWDGAQYVVRTQDGEATFKEYHANPARLVPLSNNPAHTAIKLGDEPIEILGRVWSWTVRARPRPGA